MDNTLHHRGKHETHDHCGKAAMAVQPPPTRTWGDDEDSDSIVGGDIGDLYSLNDIMASETRANEIDVGMWLRMKPWYVDQWRKQID